MAIQSQPSRISEPFAGSGSKNTIPATNATPSASQAASWASGFPPECSQPISAGGCPVPRNDVNGVLNQISQDYAFRQDGGIWEWSALADYDTSRIVRGSDGRLYFSVAQSGPSIAAGAQNPTLDAAHAFWDLVSTDDSDVVHRTGAEEIDGVKTFKNFTAVEQPDTYSGRTDLWVSTKTDIVDIGTAPQNELIRILLSDNSRNPLGIIECATPGSSTPYSIFRFVHPAYSSGGHSYEQNYTGFVGSPDHATWFDTFHLMCHGAHPYFVFRNQNIPAGNKGTYPSSAQTSSIYFSGDDRDTPESSANNRYAAINNTLYSNGSVSLIFASYRNSSGNASAQVSVVYKYDGTMSFGPVTDNDITLGASNTRWKQLYAGTATINTSDARLKTEPEAIPDAVLDAWGDVGWQQFQMLDAVAEKGADKARLHSGLIAQRIDEAFKARGLDVSRYGLFCHDEWEAEPEERDEHGNVEKEARPAGDIYSLRYEEALCMEAAYQRRRADRAEARLAALEERLSAIEAKLNA